MGRTRDDDRETLINAAAERLAASYEIPVERVPTLAHALGRSIGEKAAVEATLAAYDRLAELRKPLNKFFRALDRAATSLQDPAIGRADLLLLADQLYGASYWIPELKIKSAGADASNENSKKLAFIDFIENLVAIGAAPDLLSKLTIGHDRRGYGAVAIWSNCLDPIFDFWCGELGRVIENSFNDEGGEGEPLGRGTRFLRDCMMVIDPASYRDERLMRLLDVYRDGAARSPQPSTTGECDLT